MVLTQLRGKLFWWPEEKRLRVWRQVGWFYGILFLVWGMYRLFFRFPMWVEEGIFKAAVFGLPILWVARKENLPWRQLGVSGDNFFASVYLGLALGVILGFFGQLGNIVRYGSLQLQIHGMTSEAVGGFLILTLITAFWEQLVFTGYLLGKLVGVVRNEQKLVIVVGGMFALLHVPALVVQQLAWGQVVIATTLLLLLGMGSAILRLRQKNLIGAVMAHALWGVTIFLFR